MNAARHVEVPPARPPPIYDVVVPTTGRRSLDDLLTALGAAKGPSPQRVLVVDDRRERSRQLLGESPPSGLAGLVEVVPGGGRGPAAARNVGWRASASRWGAFLDDDVLPEPDWYERLAEDLLRAGEQVAGVQGVVRVPLPPDRRATDFERNVAGLERARWATADMAYRREALEQVGGFDERFPRAYREDADLGLRIVDAGWRIDRGRRTVLHPVRPAGASASLRLQAGNADDVLMRALHGADWRERAGCPPGRRPRHVATVCAGALAAGALAGACRRTALVLGLGWLGGTVELAWARAAPGPRSRRELIGTGWTSLLMPAVATAWWLVGVSGRRRLLSDGARAPRPTARTPRAATRPVRSAAPTPRRDRPAAVLLDRDGTLIRDVAYNGDPALVEPVAGAREALDRLRAAGVPLALVSNQSGVARGLITREHVDAVNRRVEELLGPIGPWAICPHGPEEGCACRKPAPGLVFEAASELDVTPSRYAVIGDIGADVEAARAAGARAVLVPTSRTRRAEVEAAPELAPDLPRAVDLLLGGTA